MSWLLVALGGALGAVGRFWLTRFAAWRWGQSFFGTLTVNVVGAFILGVVFVYITSHISPTHSSDYTRNSFAFFEIGFLGGFTTFSTFALELRSLLKERVFVAASYVIASILLSVFALIVGYVVGGVWFYG